MLLKLYHILSKSSLTWFKAFFYLSWCTIYNDLQFIYQNNDLIHKSCLTKLNILNLIAYNFVVKAKDLGLIKILNYYEYRIYNIFSSHKIVCEQKVRESFVNLFVSSLKSRMSTREPILIKQNSYINSSLGIGPSNLL